MRKKSARRRREPKGKRAGALKPKGTARTRSQRRTKTGSPASKTAGKRSATATLVRAARPKLRAVRRPAAKPAVAPAFRQRGAASSKQLVLFELLRARTAFLAAIQVSWADVTPEQMDRVNEADVASLKTLDWEGARRLLHTTRHELMEALESVPDEPPEVWSPEHAFGWMLHALPPHDHHHAEVLKRWRAERGV